jgi:hypothetical protein
MLGGRSKSERRSTKIALCPEKSVGCPCRASKGRFRVAGHPQAHAKTLNLELAIKPDRGSLILVLGILSMIFFPPLGIVAILMGRGDLAEIDAGQRDPEGRTSTKVGYICGIIGTILLVLNIAAVIFILERFGLLFGAVGTMQISPVS